MHLIINTTKLMLERRHFFGKLYKLTLKYLLLQGT